MVMARNGSSHRCQERHLHAQVQHPLPAAKHCQPAFNSPTLRVRMRQPERLSVTRTPPVSAHKLNRPRPRGRLHHPHLRHRTGLRIPNSSSRIRPPDTTNSQVSAPTLLALQGEPSRVSGVPAAEDSRNCTSSYGRASNASAARRRSTPRSDSRLRTNTDSSLAMSRTTSSGEAIVMRAPFVVTVAPAGI